MQWPARLAALLLLAATLSTARARAAEAAAPAPIRGPLGLRIQGVLRELFLDPILLDARPLEGSRPVFDLRWVVANSWNLPMQIYDGGALVDQLLDEQADSLTASVRTPWSFLLDAGPRLPGSPRGLWERLSTQLEYRATLHWGGWSDRPIEGWHWLTGAFNYERDVYPRNPVHLLLRDSNGVDFFELEKATLAPGDLVARTQLVLYESADAALSARVDVKLPLGKTNRAATSGGVDAAATVAASARVSPWLTLHGQLAAAVYSNFAADLALQPNRWHLFADLSAQVHFGPVDAFVEDRVASALLQGEWLRLPFLGDNGYLSSGLAADFRPHNQISFGLRFREWTAWLSEDFTPGKNPHSLLQILYVSNSPDVVVGLSWGRAL